MPTPDYLTKPDDVMLWNFLTQVWATNLQSGFLEYSKADPATAMYAAAHLLKMTIQQTFHDAGVRDAEIKEVDILMERISQWRSNDT